MEKVPFFAKVRGKIWREADYTNEEFLSLVKSGAMMLALGGPVFLEGCPDIVIKILTFDENTGLEKFTGDYLFRTQIYRKA